MTTVIQTTAALLRIVLMILSLKGAPGNEEAISLDFESRTEAAHATIAVLVH